MSSAKKIRLDTSHQVGLSGGMKWHCPICLVVPFKEIYSCFKGHSLCSLCASKLQKCPTCRVDFGDEKQRNYGLEEILDELKLKCIWDGCSEELSRGDIFEHDEKCSYNPNVLNICYLFNNDYKSCTFRFTMESLQDPRKVEQFLDHLKTNHKIQEEKVELGRKEYAGRYTFDSNKCWGSNFRRKYEVGEVISSRIFTMNFDNKKHLFMNYTRIDMNKETQEEMFSFMLVQLTPDINSKKSTFIANLFIEGFSKSTNVLEKESRCTATTSWKFKLMKIDKITKINMYTTVLYVHFASRFLICKIITPVQMVIFALDSPFQKTEIF